MKKAAPCALQGSTKGSPADEAGLETGDELLQVNDTKIEDLDLASVVALIKEQSGELTVTVRRDGQEQTFSLKAATVEIPTVTSQMMEGQTGYIRILEFDTVTVEQFQRGLPGAGSTEYGKADYRCAG